MTSSELIKALEGRPVTLKDTLKIKDDSDLPPKAQARLEAWVEGQVKAARKQQIIRHGEDVEDLKRDWARLKERYEVLIEAGQECRKQLDALDLTAEEARPVITQINAELKQVRAGEKELRKRAEQAWARVCMDPADAQELSLRRFPALRERLPRFNPDEILRPER